MAIKIIHAETATNFRMLQRFRYEAETASHLNHPNILRVHDFGIIDTGTAYLAMEYLEGPLDASQRSGNRKASIHW
jgi:serine/threonine-protein kinase